MIEEFNRNGYLVVRGLLPDDVMTQALRTATYMFAMQAMKAYPRHEMFRTARDPAAYESLADLDLLCRFLDAEDPGAFKEAQGLIQRSLAPSLVVSNPAILNYVCTILDCPREALLHEGGGLVPNLPGNTRRLYTWHSEACWLPYRRRFLNLWCPLFRTKSKSNGTMHVLPGSHVKESWPFTEYYGYETRGDTNQYLQYEIPDTELTGFSAVALDVAPGDVVFFARNLVHRSEVNESTDVGYLWIDRFVDPRADLTLSSNVNQRPYNESALRNGRPGLTAL